MYCNFADVCGLFDLKQNICCFYCEHRNNCKGICSEFSGNNFIEEIAKNCTDFIKATE